MLTTAAIAFFSIGLLVYWLERTWLLARGPEERITAVLEGDLWWGRRFMAALRSAFSLLGTEIPG